MTKKEEPTWLPITALPTFSQSVEMMLYDTEEMYPLFAQAKEKPWVLDDATVARAIRLYTERLDILVLHEEQLSRWRTEHLTEAQQRDLDRLEQQTAKTRKLTIQLLAIAAEVKKNTIDQILERDDVALAFDVLSGKLKLPQ